MQSIDRLIEVLDRLSQTEDGVRVTTLRAELDLPFATLHRLLQGLAEHGLVYQDPLSKHYHLGLRLLRLAERVRWPQALQRAVHPRLCDLRDQFGETAFLAVHAGHQVVCLEKVSGTNPVHYAAAAGTVLPVHAAAAAKAIAAYLPEDQLQRLLPAELAVYTPATITDRSQFKTHLLQVRVLGYAVCVAEMEPGVWAVAAPLFEPAGAVLGSLCLLGSESRFDTPTQALAIAAVCAAADVVRRTLRGAVVE